MDDELDEQEALVQWLLDHMNAAEFIGQLKTCENIIVLEKEAEEPYTRCEATMKRLRATYKENMIRLLRDDQAAD